MGMLLFTSIWKIPVISGNHKVCGAFFNTLFGLSKVVDSISFRIAIMASQNDPILLSFHFQ
jgi:hypothetical protein